jgi:tetratricopeptide (TPR) repeat protein
VALPADTNVPRCPRRFVAQSVVAKDLDGDGIDEILTSYWHVPEWPSFIDLYEPRTGRSRVVFQGYGLHTIGGVHDVDGSGHPTLLVSGYNNGIGWYNALGAVRLDGRDDYVARTPDFATNATELDTLAWYALLPRGYTPNHAIEFDPVRHLITVRYAARPAVTLDAAGFLVTDRSPLPPRERQAARREAWQRLREARQLLHVGAKDAAVQAIDGAVASAARANDSILIEAMTKESGEIRAGAGRAADAEGVFDALMPHAVYPAEMAFDAGKAFHLRGDLDRALAWYRKGLSIRAQMAAGKSLHEFLQGIVFILAERHDWKGALAEVERFRATFPESEEHGMYREFVRWRAGDVPRLDGFNIPATSIDVLRYWPLEFRLTRGEDPARILRDLDATVAWGPSETESALWSLRAELLARLGRRQESRDAAARSLALLDDDVDASTIARAHAELVRERAARLARKE